MTTFELIGLNPFNNQNPNILGIEAVTNEDNIKLGDYTMHRDEEELLGIKFVGASRIAERIDPDTNRVIHGGILKFDIVCNKNIDNIEDFEIVNEYDVIDHIEYEYTDNMPITQIPVMLADVFTDWILDFIRTKTNIKDYITFDFISFMLEPMNREYFTKFIYSITNRYMVRVQPVLNFEEVEYYTKLKRIVNILDEE